MEKIVVTEGVNASTGVISENNHAFLEIGDKVRLEFPHPDDVIFISTVLKYTLIQSKLSFEASKQNATNEAVNLLKDG